jgi:putative ABC transport system permease protein
VLALLAAALVAINFDRFVRKQSRELGALKAMGYSGGAIVRSYLYGALGLAAAGTVVGAAGSLAFRSAFLGIYANAHGLAYVEHHTYGSVLLASAATVLAVAIGSALLATRRLWRVDPLALTRPLLSTYSSVARVHHLVPLGRLPVTVRIGLTNLVRTPRLAAMTIVGVAIAVSLATAYLISLDSMRQAVRRSFEADRWATVVSFLYPVLDEEYGGAVAGVAGARVEGFVRAQAMLANGGATSAVSLLGLTPAGSLRHINVVAGRMPRTADEMVLGKDLARRLDVSAGSTIELRIRNRQLPFLVVGIKSDVVPAEAVLSKPVLQNLLELDEQATGMFVALPVEADAQAITAQLRTLEYVGRVTARSALLAEFTALVDDIRKLVLLVASIALVLAAVFIIANLSMGISEQATEFSTLWALGYNRRAATQVVLVNGAAQTVLALLLALPLTLGLAYVLDTLASRAWFDQPTHLSLPLLCTVASGVVALALTGTVLAFRRFWRTDLLEHLRMRAAQ